MFVHLEILNLFPILMNFMTHEKYLNQAWNLTHQILNVTLTHKLSRTIDVPKY